MPTYRVQAPDGSTYDYDVPEGTSQQDVLDHVQKQYGQKPILNAPPQQPQKDTRPTSFLQGVLEGVETPLNHGAEWLEHGLNKIQIGGQGLADRINSIGPALGLNDSVEHAEQTQQAYNAAQPVQGSGLGKFAGNVIGTAALSRLPGGAITQGAVGGALLSDDQSAGGLVKGAALGAGTSYLGGRIGNALASVIAPRLSPALQTLVDAGVRVTPGQVARSSGTRLGGLVAAAEDKATSLPISGASIQAARQQAQSDFGRATLNRALQPIGDAIPEGVTGRDAVRYAGDSLSDAYNQITPRLSATGDAQFTHDLDQIHADAQTLHPDRLTQFRNTLTALGRYFQNGSQLDGQAFKDIETRLGSQTRNFLSSNDPDARQLGQAYQQVQEAVRDLAARQNPQEAGQIAQINRGWASLTQAERAAGNSRGDITPAGYSQAVKMSSNTVRRRGYARGDALNQDLSDAASDVLPSRVADSGTAGRLGQLALGATGLAALHGNPEAIAGLGADTTARLLYSGPAQSAIRWALTHPSSPQAQRIANLIRQGSLASPIIAPALQHNIGQ